MTLCVSLLLLGLLFRTTWNVGKAWKWKIFIMEQKQNKILCYKSNRILPLEATNWKILKIVFPVIWEQKLNSSVDTDARAKYLVSREKMGLQHLEILLWGSSFSNIILWWHWATESVNWAGSWAQLKYLRTAISLVRLKLCSHVVCSDQRIIAGIESYLNEGPSKKSLT